MFVAAGGQGNDEVVSEAESMRRYLTESRHVPADAVLMEDRSTTTMENLRFSKEIMDARSGVQIGSRAPWPRRPLRAGHQRLPCVPSRRIRASGLKADGIGSHTRGYYWPTAFIREFIAVTKAHLWPYCALARPGIDRLPCATGLYRALGRDTPVVE
ncbi:YdcF family protein [uncultured Bifidobacterium sp.]|uniref:YdcF family protein n=1 Tax=uncultured Bifidobacterium sp. TaxID=165187 RepID=UPI00258C75A8|nr:YdcF family protein [uncultured Bifidobacterium sp.]